MVSLIKSMDADHPASPVLVLSNNPDAGGLEKARELGVEADHVDHRAFAGDRVAFEEALHNRLMASKPDIICLAGFMRILGTNFIRKWEGKMLNVHPSLLPRYKGLHTHQRALDAGDRQAGCTVHRVTADLDDGPILGQAKVPILSGDSAEDIAARILPFEHQLYPMVLRGFANGDATQINL